MCERCEEARNGFWNRILEIVDNDGETIKNLYTIAEEHFGIENKDEIEHRVMASRAHAIAECAALVATMCPDTPTHGLPPHVILHGWAEEMREQYEASPPTAFVQALEELFGSGGIQVAVISMEELFGSMREQKPKPRKKKPKPST